jgi:hypothetical protein
MNKCALAVVITAAATLTGCLDPNYKRPVRPSEPVDIPESKVEKHDKKLAEEPKVEEKKAEIKGKMEELRKEFTNRLDAAEAHAREELARRREERKNKNK